MTSKESKNIVILGGSYGGVSAAHYLLKHAVPRLPDPASYHVVLISTSSQAMCRPAAPRALLSDEKLPQEKLFVDIEAAFAQYGERFVFKRGTATALDCTARTISYVPTKSSDGKEQVTRAATAVMSYHALIIATGASTPSPLLGFNAKDETALRATWSAFRSALPSASHIVVAGGGASGVEVAGELGEHLNGKPGWFSSRNANPRVQITLLSGGDRVLPYFSRPQIATAAEKQLSRLGVTVMHASARVAAADPPEAGSTSANVASPATLMLSNGKTLKADLYIPATGSVPNTSFAPDSVKAKDGRIETNARTLRVSPPAAGDRVYAIGDAASAARPAVHNILAQVPVLCANVRRDLLLAAGVDRSKVGEDREFVEDTRETQLVPLGTSTGVGAAMGYRIPGFLVWLIKGRDYWLWTTGNLWSGKQWDKES